MAEYLAAVSGLWGGEVGVFGDLVEYFINHPANSINSVLLNASPATRKVAIRTIKKLPIELTEDNQEQAEPDPGMLVWSEGGLSRRIELMLWLHERDNSRFRRPLVEASWPF